SNNVAFCNEGLYGFIAPYSKADGTAGDQIYSFNAVTGDVVDQRYVPFSPTTVTVDKNSDAMVVAGSLNYNSQSTVAQLYILQADQFGRFGDNPSLVSVDVPMSGYNDWIPNQVVMTGSGYAIFSNKQALYVFSTVDGDDIHRGQILDVEQLIPSESYSTTICLLNVDFEPNNGLLSVVRQNGNESFSILFYILDQSTGALLPFDMNPSGD